MTRRVAVIIQSSLLIVLSVFQGTWAMGEYREPLWPIYYQLELELLFVSILFLPNYLVYWWFMRRFKLKPVNAIFIDLLVVISFWILIDYESYNIRHAVWSTYMFSEVIFNTLYKSLIPISVLGFLYFVLIWILEYHRKDISVNEASVKL